MAKGVLLDTSPVIEHLHGKIDIAEKAPPAEPLFLPLTSLGELYKGVLKSARPKRAVLCLDRSAFRCYLPVMKYAVLIEPVEESEGMPGFYYAHVPSLGITTHGGGIEGAMAAARDLISLWVEEMRAVGKDPKTPGDSILATLEGA